ncbi:MAG TPA: aldehyde ferredoxin oxidoreductase family protein [Syntrophales bacterium]|nr:aldehyde ferredoxin oxidoreductase family protein [Syntrophales bacterium]
MMYGWFGKMLRVDLNSGECSDQELDISILKQYIGGRGLAAKLLLEEMSPSTHPFNPENKLIFATGPLTGTGAPASGRYMVVTKSPLTGGIIFCNSGGKFGTRLKSTGYDLVVIEGRAAEPVYLSITDSGAHLKPATHLWGKNVTETDDILRSEFMDARMAKKSSIACIGIAGEKKVLYAAVMNDKYRAAARGGIGAVMGSKNLKAIVTCGTKKIPLSDETMFKESVKRVRDMLLASDNMKVLSDKGTPFLVDPVSAAGIIPTRNFQTGVFEEAERINATAIQQSVLTGRKACLSCPLACGRVTQVENEGEILKGEGPEYETIALLGPNCGIGDPLMITRAGYRCNELGLDTMSTGGTIACAMELYERGFLPYEDIGFSLNFGDGEAMIKLIDMIGERKGFGDVLAEGSYRLAEKYGHPELAMTSKKMEMSGYDPRGLKEKGLGYATSNRGACHMRGRTFGQEMVDRFDYKDRAALLMGGQDYLTVLDSCGVCCLIRGVVKVENMLPIIEAATGAGYDAKSLMKAGERIWNVERLFNQKAGLTSADDSLPKRMLTEPMPEGPSKGQVVELNKMITEYYTVRGWNSDGSIPINKLVELDICPQID